MSPLGWAVANSPFDIAFLLVEAGADFNARSLATDKTILEQLQEFELNLVGAGEVDDAKRKKEVDKKTQSYSRLLSLLQRKRCQEPFSLR